MSTALEKFMNKKTTTAVKTTEPIRMANLPRYNAGEIDLTDEFKTADGTWALRPAQSLALHHAREAKGLIGLIGCGHGKTLISFLLPTAMASKRPLLLLPAALIEKTKSEVRDYEPHFRVTLPKIISYERLSRPSGIDELNSYAPDLIICDESHKIKSIDSTRTRRLAKYLFNTPSCRLCVMSGTLYNKTVADFAHLADWVLEENSPVPRNPRDVAALDDLLTGEGDKYQYAAYTKFLRGRKPREALLDRLSTTKGVVITDTETVQASLRLQTKKLDMPDELIEAINKCFEDGVVSALGEKIDPAMLTQCDHLWEDDDAFALRALGQLCMGLLYLWDWQGERDDDWLNARRGWRRAVRNLLEWQEEFDSPALIETNFDAVDGSEEFEEEYHAWQMVKHRKEPDKLQEWVSDYMIQAVKDLVEDGTIIWVGLSAVGHKLAAELGVTYWEGGTHPTMDGKTCIMSIKSHGTGLNLQKWSKNIVLHPIADPSTWEQLIARTHRNGQLADEVTVTVFTHSIFGSSLSKAVKQSKVIQDSTSQPMRLAYADRITL